MPGNAAPSAALSLLSLPDDLLLRILTAVPLEERLSRAALVCRRLRQLMCAPELLRAVVVKFSALPPLHAFRVWLNRHAAFVQRLELTLSQAIEEEAGAIAAACAAACGAAGQLQQLRISSWAALPTLSWLSRMRSLRSLEIDIWFRHLQLSQDLSMLTSLHSLVLRADGVSLTAGARLPTSLTHLQIFRASDDGDMPMQVAQLASLSRLELVCRYSAAGMASISRLTGLTRLALDWSWHCPPFEALARLRLLHHLRLECTHIDATALDAALQGMRQLRSLQLAAFTAPPIPPSTANLRHLERLWWWSRYATPGQPAALPHPHSLHSLQHVGVVWSDAAASLPALCDMPALTALWLVDVPLSGNVPPPVWDAFWGFVEQHAALQQLRLGAEFLIADAALEHQRARLRALRPAIVINRELGDRFFSEAFHAC